MAGLYEHRLNRVSIDPPGANSNTQIDFPFDRGVIHVATAIMSIGATRMTRAEIETHVPQVVLNLNGDDYGTYKTSDILWLDDYYGSPFSPGKLPLRFLQKNRRLIEEAEATSFVPGSYTQSYLMYEYDGTIPANAGIQQELISEGLGDKKRAVLANAPIAGRNQVIKHYRKNIVISTSGAGNPNLYDFDTTADKIRALHFRGANITEIKIKVDEQERWHFATRDDLNEKVEEEGRTPQANAWHVDFEALGGSVNAAFDPNYGGRTNKIQFEITTSNDDDVSLLAELYNKPQV